MIASNGNSSTNNFAKPRTYANNEMTKSAISIAKNHAVNVNVETVIPAIRG